MSARNTLSLSHSSLVCNHCIDRLTSEALAAHSSPTLISSLHIILLAPPESGDLKLRSVREVRRCAAESARQ